MEELSLSQKCIVAFILISTSFNYVQVFGRNVSPRLMDLDTDSHRHGQSVKIINNQMEVAADDADNDDGNMISVSSYGLDEQERRYELYLDNAHNILMHWNVDYKLGQVIVDIQTKSSDRDDGLAIGFSDYGEVIEADFCVLWWDKWSNAHFQDSWSDADGLLHLDEKQDCHLKRLRRNDEGLIYTFRRAFDTCDKRDFLLDFGTIHIVYAILNGPMEKLNGISIFDGPHGFQRTQMLKSEMPTPKFPNDTRTFAVLAKETRVPSDETTYWCRLVQLPKLDTKRHIVQFEAVIQPGHETLVHHMEVFHCVTNKDQKLPYYDGPCMGSNRPPELEPCKKVIAAWAMGAPPMTYPEEAGLPIGGPTFAEYVILEIHYNNELKRGDYVDSSGIRFHYTSQTRKYDAGVLEVGLEYTPKMAIPPRQPSFILSGHCIVQCTEVALSPRGIVLFAAQLHTHLTGTQVIVRHYRGGQEMAEVARDDHYSPHFQEIRHLRSQTLVLPGDALVTSCTYNSMQRENITLGGYAIREEMCVSYIHYYPKSELEVCKSSIDTDVLNEYFRFMNQYEEQGTSITKDVPENYQAIDWTPLRSNMLHELYEIAPLSMQCNRSSGERFPGYWNNAPQTEVSWSLPKSPRICSRESAEYILSEPEYN